MRPAWCSYQAMRPASCSCQDMGPAWRSCQDMRVRAKTCGQPGDRTKPCGQPRVRAKTCGQPAASLVFVPRHGASLALVPRHACSCQDMRPAWCSYQAMRPASCSCQDMGPAWRSCQDMRVRAKTRGQPGVRTKPCGQPRVRAKTWGQPGARAKTCVFVPRHAASLALVPRHAASSVRAKTCSQLVFVQRHACGQPGVHSKTCLVFVPAWWSGVRGCGQPGFRAKTCGQHGFGTNTRLAACLGTTNTMFSHHEHQAGRPHHLHHELRVGLGTTKAPDWPTNTSISWCQPSARLAACLGTDTKLAACLGTEHQAAGQNVLARTQGWPAACLGPSMSWHEPASLGSNIRLASMSHEHWQTGQRPCTNSRLVDVLSMSTTLASIVARTPGCPACLAKPCGQLGVCCASWHEHQAGRLLLGTSTSMASISCIAHSASMSCTSLASMSWRLG